MGTWCCPGSKRPQRSLVFSRNRLLLATVQEAQHTLDQVQLEVSSLRHQLNAVEEERSRMSAAALHLDKAHTAEEAQHRARMEELCQAVAEAELLTMQLRQQLAETQDQLIQKAERLAFEEARAAGLGAGLQAADQQLQELQVGWRAARLQDEQRLLEGPFLQGIMDSPSVLEFTSRVA